jgi:ribokinase
MDLVVRVSRLPQPGETVIGGTFLRAAGGKGANQAVAAARLGAQVRMIGRVGRDPFGRELGRLLRAEGIETRDVRTTAESATGVAAIFVDAQGRNSIAVASGPNALLRPEDVRPRRLAGFDVAVAQLECPLETVQHAFWSARLAGARTVLNAAPATRLPDALLEATDVLIVNEVELATLLSRDAIPPGDEAEAARTLRAFSEQVVVVTLGERGALAVADEAVVQQPSFAVEVVDTTAAGDAFVAAFARAYWPRQNLAAALRFACAAGALATTRPGAQPSLPSAAEVEALLSRNP